MKVDRAEARLGVLFLLPAAALVAVFLYYPMLQTFVYSLYDLRFTTATTPDRWAGLGNYANVVQDAAFWASLRFTLYFTGMSVALELVIGLALAVGTFWVARPLRGLLRAIVVVPWAIPTVIQAAMWRWLYNSDVGLFGAGLVALGLTDAPPLFLANAWLAVHAVIFAHVWKGSAITAIFLMGGLATLPPVLDDAAQVDGARAGMRFWRVTLPLLAPTIIVTLLFRTVDALRAFDIVYGLTGGGPGTATEILSAFAYKYMFTFSRFGQGSAYAVVTFGLVLALALVYLGRLAPRLRFRS